jgi:glycosyltransferase involved in cell wall biosynthesis
VHVSTRRPFCGSLLATFSTHSHLVAVTRPRVSAIIAVHNGERFIADALGSVFAQTVPVDEIIVIDDGSTDATAHIASQCRVDVRVFSRPNGGSAAARNTALSIATGDYLSFLDADDLWVADKTERQLAALESDASLEAVFGHLEQFDTDGNLTERHPAPFAGAMLIRRPAFDRVGPFDPRYRVGEFVDWFARATHLGLSYAVLGALVLRRRLHESNLGRWGRQFRGDYVRVAKAALDRRRASGR